jgi:hypothetical protein
MTVGHSWDETRSAFDQAAGWFARTTGLVGERWERPGLGVWDVRGLVGHTSRALATVEAYLARPAERADLGSTADYYRATRAMAAGADIARRGREAGAALGANPDQAVADLAVRVAALISACDGTELVSTIAGGMRLADYLSTRTFELTVHTADLCAALGLPVRPPASPARQCLLLIAELALQADLAGPLLLAATGRSALPDGFTVL